MQPSTLAASALLLLPTGMMGATRPILARALVTSLVGLAALIGFPHAINAAGAFQQDALSSIGSEQPFTLPEPGGR